MDKEKQAHLRLFSDQNTAQQVSSKKKTRKGSDNHSEEAISIEPSILSPTPRLKMIDKRWQRINWPNKYWHKKGAVANSG